MTVVKVQGWRDIQADDALSDPERDMVLVLLDEKPLGNATAVMKTEPWLLEEKTFETAEGVSLVVGRVAFETDKAFLFTQEPYVDDERPDAMDDGTDFVPKSQVRIYKRASGFDATLPSRSLSEFVDP